MHSKHSGEFSAYTFSMAVTLIICALLIGVAYIDYSASDSLMNADGIFSPIINKLADLIYNV